MRPYLAIIKDSFREALASRVLWILLVLNTVILAAVAPLGITEQSGAALASNDLTDPKGLVEKIKQQESKPSPSPGKQVWSLLSAGYQAQLRPDDEAPTHSRWSGMVYLQLAGELNAVLKSRQLYDPAAWAGIELPGEAQQLLAQGVDLLDEDDVPRLNRLLLQAAYPDKIAPSREKTVVISYLTWRWGPAPMPKKLLVETAINTFVGFFVGVVGVFAGVLVTASIIPQTYAAGAIDLLLSKPISRSLLFLSKYLGGCMFTLINAGYVIGGLWLIAGLRWGQWSNRLLLCIGVFMFLFAIYYAVSSLAGVIWRNAIVSVVMAVLFWAACFGVGATKSVVELYFLAPKRLVRLVPAANDLVATNEAGQVLRWNAATSEWRQLFSAGGTSVSPPPGMMLPLVGLVYDSRHERLLALPQFGVMSSDNSLQVADRQQGWKEQSGTPAPPGTAALFVNRGGTLLAATPRGVMKLVGDPVAGEKPVKLFGFAMPAAGGSKFVSAGRELRLGAPLAAAMDRVTDAVALFDRQALRVLAPDSKGRYVERVSREIEGDLSGVVAIGGGHVLLGRANGEIMLFDVRDLKPVASFQPEASTPPRFVEVSPDGKVLAVLFHNRRLWLYDVANSQPLDLSVSGQGDISAAAFAGDRLLVADRFTRVSEYDLASGRVVDRRRPSLSMLETAYLFGIKPIYTVFPKPGEMDNVANYLLTGNETAQIGISDNLQTNRPKLDVWGPIWSNLAFIAVVVGLGCLYTRRKDF
jgi:hypothetical protein